MRIALAHSGIGGEISSIPGMGQRYFVNPKSPRPFPGMPTSIEPGPIFTRNFGMVYHGFPISVNRQCGFQPIGIKPRNRVWVSVVEMSWTIPERAGSSWVHADRVGPFRDWRGDLVHSGNGPTLFRQPKIAPALSRNAHLHRTQSDFHPKLRRKRYFLRQSSQLPRSFDVEPASRFFDVPAHLGYTVSSWALSVAHVLVVLTKCFSGKIRRPGSLSLWGR